MNLIESNINKVRELCFKHNVGHLFVFGSVLIERFQQDSDVDLIVDFKTIDLYNYSDNYFDLKNSLEDLFKRKVDLLEEQAITNPYLRQSIDATKQLVFEQKLNGSC